MDSVTSQSEQTASRSPALLLAGASTVILCLWLAITQFVPIEVRSMQPLVAGHRLDNETRATVGRYYTAVAERRHLAARDLLNQSEVLARQSLARAPADGLMWAGLAEIEWQQRGFSTRIAELLALSRVLALHEHHAALVRAVLSLRNWELLDAEQRRATVYDLETLLVLQAKHRIIDNLAEVAVTLPPDAAAAIRDVVQSVAADYLRQFDFAVAERRKPQPRS